MQRYEEMRKQRLEEAKQKDPEEEKDERHMATTVFHGVSGNTEAGKKFIDPPAYLR